MNYMEYYKIEESHQNGGYKVYNIVDTITKNIIATCNKDVDAIFIAYVLNNHKGGRS